MSNTNPWAMFEQTARIPTPDQIQTADKTKNQWTVSGQGSYSPDDVFYDSQDRHHHSGQLNVKFPQHWEPMLQEFIAKTARYRSQQDFVRTALVHQMVYEAMRDVVVQNTPGVSAPIIISEVIDNGIAAVTARYDAWERRINTFDKMCERMVQAQDWDALEEELAKYDGDVRETDMVQHFHNRFITLVAKYNMYLNLNKSSAESS